MIKAVGFHFLQCTKCINKGFAEIFFQDGRAVKCINRFVPIAGNIFGAAFVTVADDGIAGVGFFGDAVVHSRENCRHDKIWICVGT